MQIPAHWAEARIEGNIGGKKRVIRRFGWSDTSEEDARLVAERRAAEALRELQAGRPIAAREQKLPYGGEGLPIREQVLARRGDIVVTRNSYGAHCINVPDVWFADVDRPPRSELSTAMATILVAIAGAVVTALVPGWFGWRVRGCFVLPVAIANGIILRMLGAHVARRLENTAWRRNAGVERLRSALRSVPDSRFAVYETPNGWRLLALHRTYDPTGAEAQDLLEHVASDPAFAQLCRLQACFRARVSGKPWRMGVRGIRPRPGIWPVHPDRRALREAWIGEYETAAVDFAACRFLEEIGTAPVHTRCAEVQRIHDELSRARGSLPIA